MQAFYIFSKRTCLKPLNEVPSKAVTFNSEMARNRDREVDSVSSSEIDEDCSGLTQPFLHRYDLVIVV